VIGTGGHRGATRRLALVATGGKAINEIAQALDTTSSTIIKYLATLVDLKLATSGRIELVDVATERSAQGPVN
jgi:DNA-binding NarL/FixJ family response regulator